MAASKPERPWDPELEEIDTPEQRAAVIARCDAELVRLQRLIDEGYTHDPLWKAYDDANRGDEDDE